MSFSGFLSNRQIIIRLLLIILVAEFLVMLLLETLGVDLNPVLMALLDTIMLATISTPAIYIWVINPLSDSKDQAINEIEQLALTDSLTQLSNRRQFDSTLNLEFGRQARSGREFALLMLDIDEFKHYNDHYGHPRGDECLKQVARVLEKHASRSADLAARYGGEEFICIFPETSLDGAMIIAENIRKDVEALNIEHLASSVDNRVTVSIGVTSSNSEFAVSTTQILEHVDRLLYQAKEKGRNRVEFDEDVYLRDEDRHFVKLVWKDAFYSGNELIDTQHRHLFHMTDIILDAMLEGMPSEEISDHIDKLIDSVKRHFDDEIHILHDLGDGNIKSHAEEHAELIRKAEHLAERYNQKDISVGEVFHYLAYELIGGHILQTDREYFELTRAAAEQDESIGVAS